MAESNTPRADEPPAPPPLPRALVNIRPLIIGGTTAWLLAFAALAVARWGLREPATGWLWVCLCGVALGLIGLGIATWQRSAASRNSRGAQRVY
jgi:hypothetical protein